MSHVPRRANHPHGAKWGVFDGKVGQSVVRLGFGTGFRLGLARAQPKMNGRVRGARRDTGAAGAARVELLTVAEGGWQVAVVAAGERDDIAAVVARTPLDVERHLRAGAQRL